MTTFEWATGSGDGGTGDVTVASDDVSDVAQVSIGGLLDRREMGRGDIDRQRESSRDLRRGELGERDDLQRDSGRNTDSNRRDQGR